jgi:hypothetical protein
MSVLEFLIGTVALLLIFGSGFLVGAYILPHEKVIEKEIKIMLPCEPCEVVQCPVVSPCPAEKIIEREIQVLCPECKCFCTSHGAYEEGKKVWWYADNQTTGYTP